MEEKIKDYPDYVKVDKAFVINTNEQQYRSALLRKQTAKKLGTFEERITNLESSIQTILDILQNKQSTSQQEN